MTPPTRSIPELIAAAQRDGWAQDPLGRAFIAELVGRQQMASKHRLLLGGLALALAGCLTLNGLQYAQGTRLEERSTDATKGATFAERTAKERLSDAAGLVAAEKARAEDAVRQRDEMIKAVRGENTAITEKLTAQITALSKENYLLQSQNADLRAEIKLLKKP